MVQKSNKYTSIGPHVNLVTHMCVAYSVLSPLEGPPLKGFGGSSSKRDRQVKTHNRGKKKKDIIGSDTI